MAEPQKNQMISPTAERLECKVLSAAAVVFRFKYTRCVPSEKEGRWESRHDPRDAA